LHSKRAPSPSRWQGAFRMGYGSIDRTGSCLGLRTCRYCDDPDTTKGDNWQEDRWYCLFPVIYLNLVSRLLDECAKAKSTRL
jgi:hypothetical protein